MIKMLRGEPKQQQQRVNFNNAEGSAAHFLCLIKKIYNFFKGCQKYSALASKKAFK